MSSTRAVLATAAAARAWLRSLLTPGPRMVDEAECVGSVLLATLIARRLGSGCTLVPAKAGSVNSSPHPQPHQGRP